MTSLRLSLQGWRLRGRVPVECRPPAINIRPIVRLTGYFGYCASVAQLAEQRFCKPQVVGSSPTAGFLHSDQFTFTSHSISKSLQFAAFENCECGAFVVCGVRGAI